MEKIGTIVMSRQQLYDEIWKISVSGVAKKYNLDYAKLIATCKSENIPFPSSGYWTKLNFGKDVSGEVIMLPPAEKNDIELVQNGTKLERLKSVEIKKERLNSETVVEAESQEEDSTNVAKSIDEDIYEKMLPFLPVEERKTVVDKAMSLEVNEGGKLHSALVQYKRSIEKYNKQLKEAQDRAYYNPRMHNPKERPEFIFEVSDKGIERIIVILDVIFKAIEGLGGHVNEDLSVKIKNDNERIRFAEGQDKVKHELTKKEARELMEYNDAIKYHRYASKPQIRQWDNVYNGKLRIIFGDHKYIRDNATEKLENRLGDILIALYEKAEENRIDRERREEQQRKREEEARKREEYKKRKELEIQRTNELANKAEDYRVACDIRAYIAAVVNSGSEVDSEWIVWAKKKADWYDPTIALEDEFLGKREHGKSKEEKELGKQGYNSYRGWNW